MTVPEGFHLADRTEPYPGELDQAWQRFYKLENKVRVIGETVILGLSLFVGTVVGVVCLAVPTDAPSWMRIGGAGFLALMAGLFPHGYLSRKFRDGVA